MQYDYYRARTEIVGELNTIHPNLVIAENLPADMTNFQFVFIDSVSKAGLTIDDLTRLRKQNPKTAFI